MAIEDGMFGLNVDQMRFLENILIGMPRIDAYMDVYTENTNRQSASKLAGRILKKDGAKKYLHKRREELLYTEGLTKEKFISELAKIGFLNIDDVFDRVPEGIKLKEFHEMPPSAKAAIARIETSHKGYDEHLRVTTKVTLADKLRALEMLIKIMGYDQGNPLVSIQTGVVLLPDASVEQIAAVDYTEDDDTDDDDGPE